MRLGFFPTVSILTMIAAIFWPLDGVQSQLPSPRACDAARRQGVDLRGCERRAQPPRPTARPPRRPARSPRPRVPTPASPARSPRSLEMALTPQRTLDILRDYHLCIQFNAADHSCSAIMRHAPDPRSPNGLMLRHESARAYGGQYNPPPRLASFPFVPVGMITTTTRYFSLDGDRFCKDTGPPPPGTLIVRRTIVSETGARHILSAEESRYFQYNWGEVDIFALIRCVRFRVDSGLREIMVIYDPIGTVREDPTFATLLPLTGRQPTLRW